MDIAQVMLTTFNDDPDLLKKVITSDESWVYSYDIETKDQSSQWKRPEKITEKSKQEMLSIPKSAFQKSFENW